MIKINYNYIFIVLHYYYYCKHLVYICELSQSDDFLLKHSMDDPFSFIFKPKTYVSENGSIKLRTSMFTLILAGQDSCG